MDFRNTFSNSLCHRTNPDKVVVFNAGPQFGRVVKRIRAGQGDTIELVSDNAKYPPKAVPLEQHDQIIIGRVAWVWQSM